MESTIDRTAKMAGTQLTKMRWALGLNGLLAVVLGVVILVWPGISLDALTIVFGAYAFITGAVSLVAPFSASARNERGWLIVSGLLGIADGVMVLVWPSISALALLYVIGIYALALGILAIYSAFWLPIDGGDTALMILSCLVSIARLRALRLRSRVRADCGLSARAPVLHRRGHRLNARSSSR